MRETKGDLFQTIGIYDAMCITTNGMIKKNGDAVLGRGCAAEAVKLWPSLPKHLGKLLSIEGNHVHKLLRYEIGELTQQVLSFPVKHNWRENADLDLIKRSCFELIEIADNNGYESIVIPRPGCGNGKLQWVNVSCHIEGILDDRFYIISY